jgi:predicted phosphodiesterase
MALQKEIIVIGDVEMGAGNFTDDFISDEALSELIIELGMRDHPIDLILNGDTFDFLKCPYFEKNQLTYPRHITKEISLSKLNLIYHAHNRVFRALRKFSKNEKNHLFFIIGNHDFDLVYTSVQNKIKEYLNNPKNVSFRESYHFQDVYVEHGHQYDFLNKINFDKLFLTYKKKQILNLPFIALGLISKFMVMKEDHPFLERIFPRPTLFSFERKVIKKITLGTVSYFLKSMFYYPFRYYFDPTYTYPRELFSELYRRIKKVHWDVDNVIHVFKRKKRRSLKKNWLHILGHVHDKYIEDKKGTAIIHPGSWRDEYDLDKESKKLTSRPKRYVQVLIADEGKEYQVIDHPIKRSPLDFTKVVNNELKHLKLAAKEENFEPVFY